tara:strand:- start:48 stop:770 length:723 start_codon:yes stop_codon:yes gene_type:complete
MNKIYTLLIISLLFHSCGLKKVDKVVFLVPPQNDKELIARVNAKNNYPEWLYLKGKINLKNKDQNVTFNVSVKNRKDSIIWLNISAPFGIEVFRAQLTPDSIYFINRTNKTWFIKSSSRIKDYFKTEIYFDEVQEMITANTRVLKQKYSFSKDENYTLNSQYFNYTISTFYRILNASLVEDENKIDYSFSDFNENNFPKEFSLKIKSKESFEATLNYSKIEFNSKQIFPFIIPDSYVEIK